MSKGFWAAIDREAHLYQVEKKERELVLNLRVQQRTPQGVELPTASCKTKVHQKPFPSAPDNTTAQPKTLEDQILEANACARGPSSQKKVNVMLTTVPEGCEAVRLLRRMANSEARRQEDRQTTRSKHVETEGKPQSKD